MYFVSWDYWKFVNCDVAQTSAPSSLTWAGTGRCGLFLAGWFDQKSSILCWPHTLRIFVIFVITPCTNLDVKLSPRKLFRTVSICDLVYSAIHISVQDYMRFPDASPAFTPPTLFYHGRLLVHWIYWLFRNPSIWCEGHPQSVTSDRRLKRQYTQCSDCRGNTNENIFGPNVSEF